MNKELINVNQDSLGKQGSRISRIDKSTGSLEIWAGEQSNGFAIILFNRSLNKESMTVKFKDTGYIYPGGNLSNLITDENYGYIIDGYTTDVNAHSVVVLKLHMYCDDFLKSNNEIINLYENSQKNEEIEVLNNLKSIQITQ